MNVSILIASFGDPAWGRLAGERALPSATAQVPHEVIIRHEESASLAATRNLLAMEATGDWLCFLDADDELAPGYLAAMEKAMRFWNFARRIDIRENPVLLVPAVEYVGTSTPVGIPQRGSWPRLNECVIGTLVPRELFNYVGGFGEWPSLEDYDLWLRCFDAGARLSYVEAAVYRAYIGGTGRNIDQSPYAEIWAQHLARTSV